MSDIAFTKMHGAGNDFVVLDAIAQPLPPLEAFSRRIADRHFGIGCDQVLVVERPTPGTEADFRMDIYNADGSRVEMCANGIRAFYKFLRDHGHTRADAVRVETTASTEQHADIEYQLMLVRRDEREHAIINALLDSDSTSALAFTCPSSSTGQRPPLVTATAQADSPARP